MESIVFWMEKDTSFNHSNRKLSAVMNFNLWTQCGNTNLHFLDIGFNVSNIVCADRLHLYIPFGKEGSIEDLSDKICTPTTISAIFNESYSVTSLPNTEDFLPIKDVTSGKVKFVVYSWKVKTGNTLVTVSEEPEGGVYVNIESKKIAHQIENYSKTTSEIPAESDVYFRFRVKFTDGEENIKALVRKYNPSNTFLQSTFATTYIVGFRFNDNRTFTNAIRRRLDECQNNQLVSVEKLHFLLMTQAHVDVEIGAKDSAIRELEPRIWDEYVGKEFKTTDIVAYHCAEKIQETDRKSINQWEFFAKIKVNNSTMKVILSYLACLVIITVICNLISAAIEPYINYAFGFLASLIQSIWKH